MRNNPHCPYCGRTFGYSKESASVIVDEVWYQGFHCRGCGEDYNVLTECEAPILKAQRTSSRKRDSVAARYRRTGDDYSFDHDSVLAAEKAKLKQLGYSFPNDDEAKNDTQIGGLERDAPSE
jgi:hypothetical protein